MSALFSKSGGGDAHQVGVTRRLVISRFERPNWPTDTQTPIKRVQLAMIIFLVPLNLAAAAAAHSNLVWRCRHLKGPEGRPPIAGSFEVTIEGVKMRGELIWLPDETPAFICSLSDNPTLGCIIRTLPLLCWAPQNLLADLVNQMPSLNSPQTCWFVPLPNISWLCRCNCCNWPDFSLPACLPKSSEVCRSCASSAGCWTQHTHTGEASESFTTIYGW